MADKRKRVGFEDDEQAQPADKKNRIDKETPFQIKIKPIPFAENSKEQTDLLQITEDDEGVIEGVHEFNPLYIKREPVSPHSTDVDDYSDESSIVVSRTYVSHLLLSHL